MIHAFQYNDRYLLLDVESGAVHVVDELAYEAVKALEAGGREQAKAALLERGFPAADVDEVLDELAELEKEGQLFEKEHDYVPVQGGDVVKAMCLHVAHDCNLRCKYCFASTGEYHLGRAMMPLSIGKQALDFLVAHSGNRKNLEVDFFGGEPLMNFDVVKEIVAYGRRLEKEHGKRFKFTITTNCVGITPEIIDFCSKEMHNVVLSIDGRKEVHDALRKTANGKGSFDIVLPKALEMGLTRQKAGQDYYVRGTFTRRNLDFCEDVKFLADQGFEQISVEPVVLPDDDPDSLREEDMARIFEEYDKLAKMFYERRKDGRWFNFFHFMIDLAHGPCIAKRMTGCGAGSEYVAVTPQGDIYPCHQFVGNTDFLMGSVITGEFNRRMQKEFKGCNVFTKEKCRSCWAKYYCSGGCAANAFNFNGDIHKPYERACDMEKKRLECAIGVYAQELEDRQRAKQDETAPR